MAPETNGRPTLESETATQRRRAVEIRPPVAAELRACRMMLPEAFQEGVTPDLLLAVERDPHRFVGAIWYAAALFGGEIAWRIQVHVVRGSRRRGIGRSLVDALVKRGGERHVTALVGIQPEDAADGPWFLTALGFIPAYRSSVYVGTISRHHSIIGPLAERVRARGMVPGGVRTLALTSAPRDRLLAFLRETAIHEPRFMTTPWEDLCRRPSVRNASVALLDGDHIVGAILAERHGTLADVHWRVVAPAYRGGWANVILTSAMWDRMLETGVTHMKFSTSTDTPDTDRMARLYNVEQSYRLDHYVRRLT